MPNNELQELLGARFERYEHQTNDAVWDAIESKLDKEQLGKIGIRFWLFNGTAIAMLVGLLIQSSVTSSSTSIATASSTVKHSQKNDRSPEASVISAESVTASRNIKSAEQPSTEQHGIEAPQETAATHSTSNTLHTAKKKNENTVLADQNVAHTVNLQDKSREENDQTTLDDAPSSSFRPVLVSCLDPRKASTLKQDNNREISHSTFSPKKRIFLKPIPIFLNAQTSYLNRLNSSVGESSTSSNVSVISNHLANNRHFDFNLMPHFQFTPKVSAGIGFGYSTSSYSNSYQTVSNQGISKHNVRSEQSIYILPIQAKYTLLQRSKFQLNVGLSWLQEFGKTDYSITTLQEDTWSVISTPTAMTESNISAHVTFRQMSLEPFGQISYHFLPRFSTHFDVGYRRYLGDTQLGQNATERLHYWKAGIGLTYQLR
ncbi:MAG: hypothetical protein HWE22_10690 [Flavobacteriales bacterium]|nr:hypothetical protein [Flavobacteriales bacterium]